MLLRVPSHGLVDSGRRAESLLLHAGGSRYLSWWFPVGRWVQVDLGPELALACHHVPGQLALLVILKLAVRALVEGGGAFETATHSVHLLHVQQDVVGTSHLNTIISYVYRLDA